MVMPVLSLINAGVGIWLPTILPPQDFGSYALAVTLFQYGLIFDCGTAQLIDREVPIAYGSGDPKRLRDCVSGLLWSRLYIGTIVLVGGTAALYAIDAVGRLPFSAQAGSLSLAGGIFFMIALGPAAVFRSCSQHQQFTMLNAATMSALAIGRPVGLLYAGVVGSFAVLVGLYGTIAVSVTAMTRKLFAPPPTLSSVLAIGSAGLPLAISNLSWAFYMTVNRWVVSLDADPVQLGHFAFGGNITYLIVGTFGALCQFYYPRIVRMRHLANAKALSWTIARDHGAIFMILAVGAAAGMFIGPSMIHAIYPKYGPATQSAVLMIAAAPALTIAAWLLSLGLATTGQAWTNALVVYPVALTVLAATTFGGMQALGIRGAAIGLTAGAIPLVLLQLGTLASDQLLTVRHASAVGMLIAVGTLLLLVLALII
jgi:O-antigen/teichoic acid export membrane protein